MLAKVADQATGEGDGRRALHGKRVGENACLPAVVHYLGGEDTFGHEYRRWVYLKKPIV